MLKLVQFLEECPYILLEHPRNTDINIFHIFCDMWKFFFCELNLFNIPHF